MNSSGNLLQLVLPLLLVGCSEAQVTEHAVRTQRLAADLRQTYQNEARLAVVVGVGDYPTRSGLSHLKYAAQDAKDVTLQLKSLGYNVAELIDANATSSIVRKTLSDLTDALPTANGTVIFYFSGHGFSVDGKNYLAGHDATVYELDRSGLPVEEIQELLRATKVDRIMLWIDACRNDPGVAAKSANLRTFNNLSVSSGMRILFSTKAGGVSYENDELKHGVFTHYLLEGLRGKAAGNDEMVTFSDLASFVTAKVRVWGFERGEPQTPYTAGEAGGDFLVADRVVGAVSSPSASVEIQNANPERELFDKGMELIRAKNLDAALDLFDRALLSTPNSPILRSGQVRIKAIQQRWPEVVADCTETIRLNPDRKLIWAYFYRGYAFEELHEYTRAIGDLDRAVSLGPSLAGPYLVRSAARKALGDKAGAEADRRQAKPLLSKDRDVLMISPASETDFLEQ